MAGGGTEFRMLALDIDGTLIGRSQQVADDVRRAVADAEAAGLKVVLTTGRIYSQTLDIWRQLGLTRQHQPMALCSGAMVSDARTGMTLWQRPIAPDLAARLAERLAQIGHSALAFADPWRHRRHYFLVESRDVEVMRGTWMQRVQADASVVAGLQAVADLDVLRLTAVAGDRAAADKLAAKLTEEFAGQLQVWPLYVPAYDMTIVEATAARANKWSALMYVAQGWSVPPRQIVAVGDDGNDVPMLRAAGLSAAMPHAPAYVRQAADVVAEAGLADFIRRLLDGQFASTSKAGAAAGAAATDAPPPAAR